MECKQIRTRPDVERPCKEFQVISYSGERGVCNAVLPTLVTKILGESTLKCVLATKQEFVLDLESFATVFKL